MRASWRHLAAAFVAVAALGAAGCSGDDDGAGGSGTTTTGCAGDGQGLRTSGRITIATPGPAVAPWFEDDDPANGKGYESEVAYAVAGEMGLAPGRITWTRSSLADAVSPGDKDFDVFIGQAVISGRRREAVDLSAPYYALGQALLAPANSTAATSVGAVAELRLGVMAGTSSVGYVTDVLGAEPPTELDDEAAIAPAFAGRGLDAVVTDIATAVRLAGGLPGTSVVAQFAERPQRFGFVLERGSGLTGCVDDAVGRLETAGTLQVLEQSYLTQFLDVPTLGG